MAEQIKERKLPNYTPFEIIGRKKRIQKKININGIEIFFPYDVYPNQIKYMEKVIELLNNNITRTNFTNIGALESPTGTGKTLCLLCSTLAWMNEMRRQQKFGGKIIYTTRTHSQITQIIHELRKTCYWPKTAVLASRDLGCINPKIRENSNGAILNIKCRKKNGLCPFYNGVLHEKRERNNCLDIESLCENGKKQTFCPFYQQIESAKTYGDIAFMPYNYIFDEEINKIMGLDIEDNIIIIDEAHNLRRVCEDSKSIEINSNDFNDMISDLEQLFNYDEGQEALKSLLPNQEKKKTPLVEISKEALKKEINNVISIQKRFNSPKIKIEIGGKKLSYKEFFEIFISNEVKNKIKKKKISYKNDDESSVNSNISIIPDTITIFNIKEHINFFIKVEKNFEEFYEKGTKLSILLRIFNVISYLSDNPEIQGSYNFFIENEEIIQKNKELNNINEIKKIRKFNIFCFNPQIQFSDIIKKNPYSIIFTSGTLTPFKIFEDELGIKFDITLENEHIVPKEQFQFLIKTDYSEIGKYRFDYNNRDNFEMVKSLGYEINNYCMKTLYGGILVFFPSYAYLNNCIKIWNDTGINLKIKKYKEIYIDSAKDKNFVSQIKKNPNKNYIIFSVFRGSSSEGIDFSDDCARVVICIGVPFANRTEKRVRLKIEYLNNINRINHNLIGGDEWYVIDAMTAVNQSLGRVLRHKNDYGVMICIDERYKIYQKYFSYWIREHYEKYKNNNSNIKDYFREQRQKFKNEKIKNPETYYNIDSNKSGFNSTITFENNSKFKNINNINNRSNENEIIEKFNNDYNVNRKISDEFEIESIGSDENINDIIKKNSNENEGLFILLNVSNVNIEKNNILNLIDNKNNLNNNEIFDLKISSLEEKNNNKNNDINNNNKIKEKKEDDQMEIMFNKYQKEGKELLDSLNEFINNNENEFKKIINKYK